VEGLLLRASFSGLIAVSVGEELGTQARGPIPYGEFGFVPGLPTYTYDPAKAKELMRKAGFPNGIGRTLLFTYAAENAAHAAYAPLVKESLEKIGIPVEVRAIMWNSQWEMIREIPRRPRIWAAVLVADLQRRVRDSRHLWKTEKYPFFNFAYYSNPEYDKLIDQAYATPDQAKALSLYKAAQEILMRDAPSVYLFDLTTAVPMRENVEGYVINPSYPKAMYFYGVYKK
jgi:peptide/nickel transport system substrate-binding protein